LTRLIARHGPLESFPTEVFGDHRDAALLFKRLATLRADAPLFTDVDALRWRGPEAGFVAAAEALGDARIGPRVEKLASGLPGSGPREPPG
jgi:hypothetical protein